MKTKYQWQEMKPRHDGVIFGLMLQLMLSRSYGNYCSEDLIK